MGEALYEEYPAAYEALYQHKQYETEVAFVSDWCHNRDIAVENALVVGCGPGHHSRHLLDRGVDVVAVDQYEAMAERARMNASGATVTVDSLPDLNTAGSFDLVWAPFTVVNHLSPDAFPTALAALAERVAPGGALVFDSMAFPEEEEWLWLRTHESEHGEVARMGDVQRLADREFRWHTVVFFDDSWFIDRHDLYVPEESFVTGALSTLGFEANAEEGYGPDDRSTSPTFLARRTDR